MIKIINQFIVFLVAGFAACTAHSDDASVEFNDNTYKIISNVYSDSDFEFNLLKSMDVRNLKIPHCEDVNLDFASCTPTMCKVHAKFGDVIYKIKGKDQRGACLFVERTTGVGGVNCTLEKDQLKDMEIGLIERVKQLEGNKSDYNFEPLKKIYSNCEVVEDYKTVADVQINFDYNSELDPEFNVDNFSNIKVVSAIQELSQTKDGGDVEKFQDKDVSYKSIFFE